VRSLRSRLRSVEMTGEIATYEDGPCRQLVGKMRKVDR